MKIKHSLAYGDRPRPMQQVSNMFIYNFTKQWLKTSKKTAVILKICVGFRAATPDPAGGASDHPRPPS